MKWLKALVLMAIPALCLAAAISPYGIFGGVTTMAALPTAPAGTRGFTSDQGLVTSDGTNWWTGGVDVGTTFTVASGCGTVGNVKGGARTGSFTAGATSCVPVINLPTAKNGWDCHVWDITTNTDTLKQTASTTTTATLSGTVVSADVVQFSCDGF